MLRVDGLSKVYGRRTALDDVTFGIAPGETVGLVGASGAGKSTIGRCVLGQERPTSGGVSWNDLPIRRSLWRTGRERRWRRDVQLVPQDPRAALDPRWTVGRSVAEPARNFPGSRSVLETFELVGLDPALRHRYPHELSTGQCQRACIARALTPRPKLLVLDEPLSALDLPVQAQIRDLLAELHRADGLSYLFISHDLVAVAALCARVIVLERGRIVEEAATADLLTAPTHPHSKALVADTPVLRYGPA
ncbi:ABC transporter ATP-binding protein [Dactylosporangium sp. NPDC051484]|uniref:ABC transporter ATP-binding protein n=1 Tax=Dactylosporangium sp. NPDC051484 TaxID=3154942 RepID=UPI00344C7218